MRVTGLTPQDLKAYGIHDVRKSSQPRLRYAKNDNKPLSRKPGSI